MWYTLFMLKLKADASHKELKAALEALNVAESFSIADVEPDLGDWVVLRMEDGFRITTSDPEDRPYATSTVEEALSILLEE